MAQLQLLMSAIHNYPEGLQRQQVCFSDTYPDSAGAGAEEIASIKGPAQEHGHTRSLIQFHAHEALGLLPGLFVQELLYNA